jgi:cellobiose transport system substrate-binding protein
LVGACGGGGNGGDGDGELEVWHRPGSLGEDVKAAAKERFPDYDITFVASADIDESLRAAMRSRSGLPDVAYFGGTLPDYFSVEDQFIDLDEYGFADHEDDYFSVSLAAASSPEGRQIVAPTDIGPWVFFYNAAEFEKAGLPTEPADVTAAIEDWESYRALAEKFAQDDLLLCDSLGGVYQLGMFQKGYMYYTGGNGEELKLDLENPIHRQAWDNAVQWAQAGLCGEGAPFTTEWNAAVTQGRIAGFVGAGWDMGILKTAAEDASGDWRVATGTPGGTAGMAGSYVGALAATDAPEAATDLVLFLSGQEAQSKAFTSNGLIPSTVASYDDPEVGGKDPFFGDQDVMAQMRETTESAEYVPIGPNGNSIMSQFTQALVNVANGADPDAEWEKTVAATSAS